MGNGEGAVFAAGLELSVGVGRDVTVGLGIFATWVAAALGTGSGKIGMGVGMGATVEATRAWAVGTMAAVGGSNVDSESDEGADTLEQAMASTVKNTKTISALRMERLLSGGPRLLRQTPNR